MTLVRRWWKAVLVVVATIAMAVVIVQSAMADPPTLPREADRDAAAREIADEGDLRLSRPEGDWLGGLGVIEPARPESRLAPAASGRIARIAVTEGERVRAGTVLVELELGAEQAALAAAEAEVLVAQAELARTRRGLRPEEREALERDARAAEARAELSEGVVERLRLAASGGGVSVDELHRAERQAAADRATAEGSSARRRAGQRGRREDVLLNRARLAAAEARRDQARANLERRRIVAPIDGEVLEVLFRVGEYVTPGGAEPVVVMGDTERLRARIDIDERDVARVGAGAEAIVVVDALPGRRLSARVVEIGRRMGRKNVRTDEPTERLDTKILEVVVELESNESLIVGQRVMGYVAPRAEEADLQASAAVP